jgi:hypothetical protein
VEYYVLCFRLEESKSLFNHDFRQNLSHWQEELNVCSCNCDYSAGCPFEEAITCDSDRVKACKIDVSKTVNNAMCVTERRKRDIHTNNEFQPDSRMVHPEFPVILNDYRNNIILLIFTLP